jgi:hypothetical protein
MTRKPAGRSGKIGHFSQDGSLDAISAWWTTPMVSRVVGMKTHLLWLLLFAVTCTHARYIGDLYESSAHRFTVVVPPGWERLEMKEYFIITRDGAHSQYILIQRREVGSPFRNTHKTMMSGMLPHEAAELIIDELRSDPVIMNHRVLEDSPAQIARHDGFRLVFTYSTRDGSNHKTVYYGFLTGRCYYSIRYNATQDHFFHRDMPAFDQVLESFRLTNRL